MRFLVSVFALAAFAAHAQTFNRNYGLSFPNQEYTAGRTIERIGINYTMYRYRRYNIDPTCYLVFQATDANGDTLFTKAIEDTLHPYTANSFESSRTTVDLFGCGLKQNIITLPYTKSYLVRFNELGDTLWYHEYSNSNTYYEFTTAWAINVGDDD